MSRKTGEQDASFSSCEGVVGFGKDGDRFVRISPEEVARINRDPDSSFKVPGIVKEAYVNRNKSSPRLAYWVYESGNVGRAFSREYRECKDGKKHEGAHEIVESYEELLNKYEACIASNNTEGEVCGIIYLTARTGERIGSRDGSASETYQYEKGEDGKPKRLVTGHIRTYGISTLRARHVKVADDTVHLSFIGKSGQPHSHVIKNAVLAGFFRRVLRGKQPDDPVFSPNAYRSVYLKFKHDTGHTIKDLRTAMAHLLVPAAKEEWIREHGAPGSKAQEKRMHAYAIKRAAEFLGNRPTTLKKSYANPDDLRSRVG